MFLSIETTTDLFSVSLGGGNRRPETLKIPGRKHSEKLIPSIEELLLRNDISYEKLRAIAVGVGPGSFTGIRVGISCAITYSQILDIPLYGLSSMDLAGKSIQYPAISAFRDKFYSAEYSPEGERVSDYTLIGKNEAEQKGCIEVEADSEKLFYEAVRLYESGVSGDWKSITPLYVMNTVYKKKKF